MSGRGFLDRRPNERLAVRRKRQQRRLIVIWAILALILVGAVFYGLWRPQVRVAYVTVDGGDPSLADIAKIAMQGSTFGVPNNSIFFVPKSRIRTQILGAYPNIAALSISRTSFISISIKVDTRVPIARWCGTTSASSSEKDALFKVVVPTASGDCYLFDAGGFVYATATEPRGPIALLPASTAATSTVPDTQPLAKTVAPTDIPITPFIVFDSLAGSTTVPITSTLAHATKLPSVFDFARHFSAFGTSVGTIDIRDDEVDFFLANNGPRITYILGDEENAFTALNSARRNFNLTDGSVQYVDLRFPGNVYLKKNTAK